MIEETAIFGLFGFKSRLPKVSENKWLAEREIGAGVIYIRDLEAGIIPEFEARLLTDAKIKKGDRCEAPDYIRARWKTYRKHLVGEDSR